jgi:hypothetical protein
MFEWPLMRHMSKELAAEGRTLPYHRFVPPIEAFTKAEEKAWIAQGRYVDLAALKQYGFSEDTLKELVEVFKSSRTKIFGKKEYLKYPAPSDDIEVNLELPFDGQAYVLVLEMKGKPIYLSHENGFNGLDYDVLGVMSPGMWLLAEKHPGSFPKLSDPEVRKELLNDPAFRKDLKRAEKESM